MPENSIFTVHESNLDYAAALIKQGDTCYLHGDGNIFDNKEASDFRMNFSNPSNQPAQHRVILKTLSQIPADLEELEKAFYAQKQKENSAAKKAETVGASKVKTLSLEKKPVAAAGAGGVKSQAELDDEALQKEIEDEEKAKKAAAGGA